MSKNNGKQKLNKGLLIGGIVLLLVSGAAFLYVQMMRRELIENAKSELVREVKQSTRAISNSIESKYAELETIQELISQSYDIGLKAAQAMENSRVRHGMAYLGLVDTGYVYYGSTGRIVVGVSKDYVDRGINGERILVREQNEDSMDGISFSMPYERNGVIKGIICSKYLLEDFANDIGTKVEDAAELLVDSEGNLILSSRDFSEYMGGITWEDISKNGRTWSGKRKFEKEMSESHSAVASAQNQFGEMIYFAAAPVENYDNLFVIRFLQSEAMESKVESYLVWVYLLLGLMGISILCILICALWNHISNRKEVYKAAYVDSLTGLPTKTRHKLDAQAYIDKQDRRYAYVTFDIDNFKYINEVFGYEYGNSVLIHIAEVLKRRVKEKELCARVSADKFAMMLLDEKGQENLTSRIERIFEAITEVREMKNGSKLCALKVSCGVFRIKEAVDINTVRANANIARMESKSSLFDEIVFYDEELKARLLDRKQLEYDAEQALKNEEFVVYFQPKFDVSTELIIGAEALVRWNHPERGMISPGVFIPLFEANGFVIELDMYVLERVCELLAAWNAAGIPPVCISVNLSRTHLYERNLVDRLVKIVKKYGIPTECIEFELTESAFYDEMGTLLSVMEDIKEKGFRLSMDDFGSGYSSLNLLQRLPVDVLKIDREFFGGLDEEEGNDRGKRIVMHVISMAKDLEMTVLAEGVETQYQKDFLEYANCDMIQGFYYAKPMPIQEFERVYIKQAELQFSQH